MIQRYDKSCLTLTEILDFQIYINYIIGLKAGNNSCRRISDKPFSTTQQDQINKPYIKEMNALFGSDKDLDREDSRKCRADVDVWEPVHEN